MFLGLWSLYLLQKEASLMMAGQGSDLLLTLLTQPKSLALAHCSSLGLTGTLKDCLKMSNFLAMSLVSFINRTLVVELYLPSRHAQTCLDFLCVHSLAYSYYYYNLFFDVNPLI